MDTIKRVYEIAEERGLTMYQVSQQAGISYSTIQTTKKRGGQLTIDTIERICDGLGIPLISFFDLSNEKQQEGA